MCPLFGRARRWLEARRKGRAAAERAAIEFRETRHVEPMGAHVLLLGEHEAIVRVMYLTNHIPPDRAWYAVPLDGAAVRELSFEDVSHLEGPWR